jgi:hypothetical protein
MAASHDRSVAVGEAQVEVLDVHVHVGQDQLRLDELPDHAKERGREGGGGTGEKGEGKKEEREGGRREEEEEEEEEEREREEGGNRERGA